jgi:transposase
MSTKDTRYSFKEFEGDFPSDAACLSFLFQKRFPEGPTCPKCGRVGRYSAVVARRSYACVCGHQVYPTAGTVFHKSPTSLKTWFFAMYLMTASKNGVSAMELMRQTGVTYKCAWRMAHQIRKLMGAAAGTGPLKGIVEADETYNGPTIKGKRGLAGKKPIIGLLQRGGDVRATVAEDASRSTVLPNIKKNVAEGSLICTDEWSPYNPLCRMGYLHKRVVHSQREYARGIAHVNSLEGFWSQVKRSIHGTFHHVSRKHLQKYVDEFSYRYNRRKAEAPIFSLLWSELGRSAR